MRDQALALQPPGLALPTDAATTWARLLLGLGDEWARIDARAHELLREADPRTTYELLPDWERALGLPDDCAAASPQTIDRRREAVIERLTARGGQAPSYYIDVAERLGFPGAEIIEYQRHSVDDSVDAALYGEAAAYAWTLRAPLPSIDQLTVDGDVDAALGETAPTGRLECTIRRLAPAHTTPLFEYT